MKNYSFKFNEIGYEVKANTEEEAMEKAEQELNKISYGLGGEVELVKEEEL
jgi:VIT1/CCC1 family predicted Fe2+/Mn2+ transporter